MKKIDNFRGTYLDGYNIKSNPKENRITRNGLNQITGS